MEQQLNREIVRIATISNNNGRTVVDQQEHRDKIKLVDFLLTGENTVAVAPVGARITNANLFFHPWAFTETDVGVENSNYIRCSRSLNKNPYIGLFHPHGSIFALNSGPVVPLNSLREIGQNPHADAGATAFSQDVCQFYIDPNGYGKAYAVCIDYQTIPTSPLPCIAQTKSAPPYRGRVELMITTSSTFEFDDKTIFQGNMCYEFINNLSNILELKHMLNTWEIDSLKLPGNTNRVRRLRSGTFLQDNGLLLFFYQKRGEPAKKYRPLLKCDFPIDYRNIPHIDEIIGNIPNNIIPNIRTPGIITWEFGISVFSYAISVDNNDPNNAILQVTDNDYEL